MSNAKLLPYLPAGRSIEYVPESHPMMARAKELWAANQKYCRQSTASVVARAGIIIGEGQDGGERVLAFCPRQALGCKSGEGYEFCPGCNPVNHSEPKALRGLLNGGAGGAELYLYGHWWCCKPCWDVILDAGVERVFLAEGAADMFQSGIPLQPLAGKNISAAMLIDSGKEHELIVKSLELAAITVVEQPAAATVVISLPNPSTLALTGALDRLIPFNSDAEMVLGLSLALSELK